MARLTLQKSSRPPTGRHTRSWAHQFLAVVVESDPLIWRRIQVAATATWWDLHVALQDAFAWEDRHLHEFRLGGDGRGDGLRVGLPFEDADVIPGWQRAVTPDVDAGLRTCLYVYDFGDDWHVSLVHEQRVVPDAGFRWSRCVAGGFAAPLEDSGGIHGYYDTLDAARDRRHPLHQDVKDWVPKGFDPTHFDPREVVVSDPRRRPKVVLAGMNR